MNDQLSTTRIKLLHPAIREDAEKFITESENTFDITLRIIQGLRTIEEQDALYAIGRNKPGKRVTNAKGGSSYHNYGLAIDLVEMKGGQPNWNFEYEIIVPIAEKYGFFWGGNFKSIIDRPHFEKTFGHGWRDLLAKVNNKDFIPETKYVNL